MFLPKKVAVFMAAFAAVIFIAVLFIFLTMPRIEKLPPLLTGDIIFQTSGTRQALPIMIASGSYYSHVGLIRVHSEKVTVVEAVGPVKETPLEEWIARGKLKRITILRPELSSESTEKTIMRNALHYVGRDYDPYFRDDKSRIYCSELVFLAYKDAGKTIGEVQKFGELWVNNPPVKKLFMQRANSHPDCKGVSAAECWDKVLHQKLITPASIAADKQLQLVYSNYPFKVR